METATIYESTPSNVEDPDDKRQSSRVNVDPTLACAIMMRFAEPITLP